MQPGFTSADTRQHPPVRLSRSCELKEIANGSCGTPSGEPFEPAGVQGVYLVPIELLEQHTLPWFINGRPVRAWAPHPEHEDLLYLTTEHPESLSFLPEAYVEAD